MGYLQCFNSIVYICAQMRSAMDSSFCGAYCYTNGGVKEENALDYQDQNNSLGNFLYVRSPEGHILF